MTRLNAKAIVDAAAAIVTREGADALTVRRVGRAVRADPTAIYRHFEDFDELRRAVGDRMLADVLHGAPSPDTHVWRDALVRCCLRLRRASLRQPAMAGLVRSGPSLHANESAITEYVLSCFASAGLGGRALADAYHAVIELTVGSAAIDASVAALPSHDRRAAYARWRRHYRNADPAVRPASRHAAKELYAGTAERRFLVAVNALIDGLIAGSGSRDGQ